jgi:GH25 family lysozyme M1 (1,4-beta-N-acetylmuramidase)
MWQIPARRCRVVAAAAMLLGGALAAGQATARAATTGSATGCPLPPGSQLQGVDVSSAQHPQAAPITWTQVASCRYRFAFVKASEGSYYVNPYYQADLAGAEAAGLLAAPYHLAIPNYSGGALQADYAVDHSGFRLNGLTLALIVDLEADPYASQDHTNACYGLSPASEVSWIGAFAAEVARRTGQLPVFYTSAAWWDKCTGSSKAFSADPLWVADYGVSAPAMPSGWTSYAYWQYSDSTTVTGVPNQADASYFSNAAMAIAAPGNQSDATGSSVQLRVNTLNADAGQQVSYSATGLPAGLAINPATGVITGQLGSSPASAKVTVTASVASGPAATATFGWEVHGPVSLPAAANKAGSEGAPVRVQLHATDGVPGCSLDFSVSGLPPGLSVSQCGLITGWLQAPGIAKVAVSVSDSSGAVLASGTFSWRVRGTGLSGPAGKVRLNGGSRCLDQLAAGRAGIWHCDGRASERWRVLQDGALRTGGKCLAGPATGTTVTLADCDGGAAQRWQQSSGATLQNAGTGSCLAAAGNGNGAGVELAGCSARPGRQWIRPAGLLASGVPDRCAGVGRGGTVVLSGCGRHGQAWTIEPDQTIRASGRCLTVTGNDTTAGSRLVLARCRHASGQIWHFAGGPIGAQLVNPHAGLCLSDPANRRATGTALALGYCVAASSGASWRAS